MHMIFATQLISRRHLPSIPRFLRPATSTRPFGCRRYDAFSPNLARSITLVGRRALDLWTTLEASASITTYCERPVQMPFTKSKCTVDFWIRNTKGEQFLVMRRDSDHKEIDLAEIDGLPVCYIDANELVFHQIALSNRGRIIRDLSAFARYIPPSLPAQITAAVGTGKAIKELQAEFDAQDPDLVQLAIFQLLHRGMLQCPMLAEKEFSANFIIGIPCPRSAT